MLHCHVHGLRKHELVNWLTYNLGGKYSMTSKMVLLILCDFMDDCTSAIPLFMCFLAISLAIPKVIIIIV